LLGAEFLDFFLQPEFVFLQLGYAKLVESGVMQLALDFAFKGLVPIVKFGDMRL
jgi:hypothetical protein